ncbi:MULTISPECIES: hypothetical protein [Alcanivorax]|nr:MULTISPECIES: hypothetical protein [Alcanivorax]
MKLRSLAAVLLMASAVPVQGECLFDPLDQGRVVKLSASQLPAASGIPLEELSVMRVEQGGFVPVAFQIDEMAAKGMVWFEQSGFDLQGQAGLFDASDELMMMLTDAGPASVPSVSLPEGELLADLQVAQDCHFYLIRNNPERSENFYVSHDIEAGRTRTALYRLDAEPDNELNWRYLSYQGYQGDGSIIDTLKMRMSAGVLSRFTRMTLDNYNLRPRLVGSTTGPIRSVMHLRTKVVLAGIPVMTLQVQAMRYAAHYEAHTYAKIPDLYRATLKDPEVSVTVDGNNQLGAHVYTAAFHDKPIVVDGQVNEPEFVNQPLTMEENWILFDSGKQFALLTELTVPAELMQTPLALIYQDDANLRVEPEQFTGQLPNLGYLLKGWPEPEELRFTVSLYFDSGMHGFEAADYARQRSATEDVKVSVP